MVSKSKVVNKSSADLMEISYEVNTIAGESPLQQV